MIRLENLSKAYVSRGQRKVVADNLNVVFPTGVSVGLIGRNGAGKSSLLRMIAGTMRPDSGRVVSSGSISWPVGFSGSFHPELSGLQNVRFIARLHGVDSDLLVESVREFAELGQHFWQPVRSYSSGMRARLAFGVSMGVHFDTYLVDETTAVGDNAFRQKSEYVFQERLRHSRIIMVSHGLGQLKRLCTEAAVLENGRLTYFPDIDEAIEHHRATVKFGSAPPPAALDDD